MVTVKLKRDRSKEFTAAGRGYIATPSQPLLGDTYFFVTIAWNKHYRSWCGSVWGWGSVYRHREKYLGSVYNSRRNCKRQAIRLIERCINQRSLLT